LFLINAYSAQYNMYIYLSLALAGSKFKVQTT